MQTCDQCGAEVTERYWRVFAIDGTLHGCLHCQRKTGEHIPGEAAESLAA